MTEELQKLKRPLKGGNDAGGVGLICCLCFFFFTLLFPAIGYAIHKNTPCDGTVSATSTLTAGTKFSFEKEDRFSKPYRLTDDKGNTFEGRRFYGGY